MRWLGSCRGPKSRLTLRSTRSPLFWTALEAALCVYTSGRIGNLMFGGYFRSAPALCLLSPALLLFGRWVPPPLSLAVSRCLSVAPSAISVVPHLSGTFLGSLKAFTTKPTHR